MWQSALRKLELSASKISKTLTSSCTGGSAIIQIQEVYTNGKQVGLHVQRRRHDHA